MKTISALKARSKLGTILNEVSQDGEHYIIERLSRPLVAVLPINEYQSLFKQSVSKKNKEELLQALSTFRKKYGKQLSGRKGTTNFLHEMRANRTKFLTKLLK